MTDSFNTRSTLSVGGNEYEIFRLDALADKYDLQRLPYSLKILLENLLRHEDGAAVSVEDIEALAGWDAKAEPSQEIAFTPARVLLQDFTGVPAVVDLAAMRDCHAQARWRPGKNQSAVAGRAGDRSLFAGRQLRPQGRHGSERADRVPAQQGTLCVSALGPEGFPRVQGGAAGHRHRSPGQPGIPGAGGVLASNKRRHARLSRHRRRNRFAYHDDQRSGCSGMGRRRDRGGSGDARPGQHHADPPGGGIQADRKAAGRRDRHGSGAYGRGDAPGKRRGRQVRRILRRRSGTLAPRRPRHHRQHGAGIRRHLRHFSGGRGKHSLPGAVRPSARTDRAGRSLCARPGALPRSGRPGSRIHRHPGARSEGGGAEHFRTQAAAGSYPSDRSQADHRRGARRHAGGSRPAQRRRKQGRRAGSQQRRRKLRAARRRRGDCRHYFLHQHLEPGGDGGGRPAGAQRPRARPQGQTLGQDEPCPGIPGGKELPGKGRADGRSRVAGVSPGGLRLHHLHRQFGTASRSRRRCGPRRQPDCLRGAFGKPQLRGPHPRRREDELSRLASPGGCLRPCRHHGHRSSERSPRPGC